MQKTSGQHNPSRCSSQFCHQCRRMSLVRESDAHLVKQRQQLCYSRREHVRHGDLASHNVHEKHLLPLIAFWTQSVGVYKCRTCPHQRRCVMPNPAGLSFHSRKLKVRHVSCARAPSPSSLLAPRTTPQNSASLDERTRDLSRCWNQQCVSQVEPPHTFGSPLSQKTPHFSWS